MERITRNGQSYLKKCVYKYDTELWEQGIKDKKVLKFYILKKE